MGMTMRVTMCMRMFMPGFVLMVASAAVRVNMLGSGMGVTHAMIGNLQVTPRSSMTGQYPHDLAQHSHATSPDIPSTAQYRIGDAARLSGIAAATIRYYEKQGLLSAQTRSDKQYRLYSDADIHQLRLLRLCRAMDMSLDEIRSLLALDARGATPQGADHAACQTIDQHLGHVRARLAELRSLEQQLLALRGRCDGTGGHCQVIATLHQRADSEPVPPLTPTSPAHRHI